MNIAQNPNSELSHFAVNTPQVFEIPETFRETARQFQEAMMQYSCAIREFKTKLEVLNDELSMRNARNPIEMIKARVKKPKSIVEKLQRRGLPLSIESMESNLDDIAGVRVICSFVDDIYEISRMLERHLIFFSWPDFIHQIYRWNIRRILMIFQHILLCDKFIKCRIREEIHSFSRPGLCPHYRWFRTGKQFHRPDSPEFFQIIFIALIIRTRYHEPF